MSRDVREPSPPDIPDHRFIELLGPGGYSTVYLYEQTSLGRKVAVKVLKDFGHDPVVLRQFGDEARLIAKLDNHPNIVQVLFSGVAAGGQPYLVMVYCPGPNLAKLAALGPLDVRKVLRAGVQIAAAVKSAHQAGIVHRDIKPANILTDDFGVRLTDFGIAGSLLPDAESEEFGVSVPWSPPEILDGDQGSVASDIYSLGATLWHLLVGRSPFEIPGGDNSRKALESRIRNVPAPRTGRPEVPAALERLLASMLAKNPRQRPVSAQFVQTELEMIERQQGGAVEVDAPWHTGEAVRSAPLRPPLDELTRTRHQGHAGTPTPPPTSPQSPTPRVEPPSPRRAPPTPQTEPATPLVWPVPPPAAETMLREPADPSHTEPADEEAVPRRISGWLWAAAAVVVVGMAVVGVAEAVGAKDTPRRTSRSTGTDGDVQDAGVLGENTPPGVPTVTAARIDSANLRFTWTYSAPLASDTFSWRTADGARSGTSKTTSVELSDPAGVQLCLQVKVVRADGSHATVDWSPAGCGS